MDLSNLAKNLRGPWMIEPEQASIMLPVLEAILQGKTFQLESKHKEPYRIQCSDYISGFTRPVEGLAGKEIYVTSITGTMMRFDGDCGEVGAETIARELRAADADPSVIGHIIVADSGGGQTAAADVLVETIGSLKKPAVAWIDGLCASACLYAVAPAAKILAHRDFNQVGCVGTMITLSGLSKYHKSQSGMISVRIYADSAGEKNLDYEEALEGNTQLIRENLLNPINERFIADMKAFRPYAQDEQLHGRVYFAKDVIGTLIDGLGSFEDAAAAVIELAAPPAPKQKSTSKQSNMNRFPQLSTIPQMAEQVFAEDGTTTVQLSQMEAIENALADARRSLADAQANAETIQADLTAKTGLVESHEATIAAKDARIAELEESLNAAIARAEAAESQVPGIVPEKNASGAGSIHAAETFQEGLEECKKFLSRNS